MSDLITQIFEVFLIPLLGVLTTFFVKWVKAKSNEIQSNINDATLSKYMNMLTETISDCVVATNQTYVDSLKSQGKFDAEAQKIAFQMSFNAVLEILNDEAKVYLTAAVGDLDTLITQKIEAQVNANKTE